MRVTTVKSDQNTDPRSRTVTDNFYFEACFHKKILISGSQHVLHNSKWWLICTTISDSCFCHALFSVDVSCMYSNCINELPTGMHLLIIGSMGTC